METLITALFGFGHAVGGALIIGGTALLAYGVWPACSDPDAPPDSRRDAVLTAARWTLAIGIVVALLTGLFKWLGPGGVGPLGNRGAYTGLLHGKIVLALAVFHLALTSCKRGADGSARTGRARAAFWLAVTVALLASLHRYRGFG